MKTIYTIGFTRKTLQQFIERLRAADVREVIDIRLRNTSQLAGWSKYPDVAYLLTVGFGITTRITWNSRPRPSYWTSIIRRTIGQPMSPGSIKSWPTDDWRLRHKRCP